MIDATRRVLEDEIREYAREHNIADLKVVTMASSYNDIHVGVGSGSFAGRPAADVQNDLWGFLVQKAPSEVVKITRLYVWEGNDFSEDDMRDLASPEK